MYASKHLSELKANVPAEASWKRPPKGPNTGFVVVAEDDSTVETVCCELMSLNPRVRQLPFPQNKVLTVHYGSGENSTTVKVLFVPVINLLLSANRYYVVLAEGDHEGQVYTCSREKNMTTCCFRRCINDVKPKPFDLKDIYQQIEIIPRKGGRGEFTAKSVASDGFPPFIFRQKRWIVFSERKSKKYQLGEAFGVDNAIRLNFLKHEIAIHIIAGKWYCPFFFVKEGCPLNYQMEKACYYEVTLTQHWRKVYNAIENRRVLLRGDTIMREERGSSDGFVWFTTSKTKHVEVDGERIGLSLVLWESLKYEEKSEGWVDHGADEMVEVKFGSSVLVEKFSFQRLDGSVAFAVDFIHTDKIRTK